MGKKRKDSQSYDSKALDVLINVMAGMRVKMNSDYKIPEIRIQKEKLEKVIKEDLSREDRESIEKFFGLIQGTTCHAKKRKFDVAYTTMSHEAALAVSKLFAIENLRKFDSGAADVANKFISMSDVAGMGEISDDDILRYLRAFILIFCGGPHMYWEGQGKEVDTKDDARWNVDDYSMFMDFYESFREVGENEINLKLLEQVIELFDLREKIQLKQCVGLPIKKEYREYAQDAEFKNIEQIRNLKERLFPNGEWTVASNIIMLFRHENEDITKFIDELDKLGKDWSKLDGLVTAKQKVFSSKEEKEVPIYEIDELTFTDKDEIIALYLNWKLLK